MSRVSVVYHAEEGSWWAESDQLPGFSAVGSSFAEVEALVGEAVREAFGGSVELVQELDGGGVIVSNGNVFGGLLVSSSSGEVVAVAHSSSQLVGA